MDSMDWSVCCECHLGEKGKGAHVAALVKVTEYRKATLSESQANRSSIATELSMFGWTRNYLE